MDTPITGEASVMRRREILAGTMAVFPGFLGGCSVFDSDSDSSQSTELTVINGDESDHIMRITLHYSGDQESVTKEYQLGPENASSSDVPVEDLDTLEVTVDDMISRSFTYSPDGSCMEMLVYIQPARDGALTEEDIGLNYT